MRRRSGSPIRCFFRTSSASVILRSRRNDRSALPVDASDRRTMMAKLKPGDRVSWLTSQGRTHGKVVKRLTATTRIKGHTAKATKDDPEILVRSAKTGAKAAHK